MMEQKRIDKEIPSDFLFRRYTCGLCKDGIRFQSVWKYKHKHKIEGGYGSVTYTFSYICKRCAPTREQLIFMSINFNDNMPSFKYTEVFM